MAELSKYRLGVNIEKYICPNKDEHGQILENATVIHVYGRRVNMTKSGALTRWIWLFIRPYQGNCGKITVTDQLCNTNIVYGEKNKEICSPTI